VCNLYAPSGPEKIAMRFAVAAPVGAYGTTVAPLGQGPIVIQSAELHSAGQKRRAVVAQWGLIPPNALTRTPAMANGQRLSTNNARRERLATAPTYRNAWLQGRRCIIPADSFDEPNWTSGKNMWWRFWRADEQPWALAGIWSEWTEPQTGELVLSYSMITQNCDGHPILGLMHKPDPLLPADQQDKRAVVSLEQSDWDAWLHGDTEQAKALIRLTAPQQIRHGAAAPNEVRQLPLI
jgi:putative SOS response-associated peptidase YedK